MEQQDLVLKISHRVLNWLQAPVGLSEIHQLRDELVLLEFLLTPVELWQSARPEISSPICSAPGCLADWHQGLINHALKFNDPVWFCQQHAPAYTANKSRPPGWHELEGPLLVKAKEMEGRWRQVIDWLDPGKPGETGQPVLADSPSLPDSPPPGAIEYTKDRPQTTPAKD